MRKLNVFSFKRIATLAACSTVLFAANVRAGFISVLRGDPAQMREYQRVAFVGSAQVKEVRGRVEHLASVDKWVPLKAGESVREGDILRTHDNSFAIVRMAGSGSLVRVTPRTVMRLVPNRWDAAAVSGTDNGKGFSVRAVRGPVSYRASNGQWQPLQVNTLLAAGAVVRTGAQSQADLIDRDSGSFVRVSPGSTFRLESRAQASRVYKEPSIASASTAVGR